MKISTVFLILGISHFLFAAGSKSTTSPVGKRNLIDMEPTHLIELIAKNDGRDSIKDVKAFKLKKLKNGYTYEFFLNNGDGFNNRVGKINLKGNALQREIDYKYCSHSMGPENRCIEAKLVESASIDKKVWMAKGRCKITRIEDNTVIHNIKIVDRGTLVKAKRHCDGDALKFLVPTVVDVNLLKPLTKN